MIEIETSNRRAAPQPIAEERIIQTPQRAKALFRDDKYVVVWNGGGYHVERISDGHKMTGNGFVVTFIFGLIVLGGLVLTPWNRVLVTKWAMRVLYAWSLLGVSSVGLAVYNDGGGGSAMYMMFPVLIVFFAISYPQRAQASCGRMTFLS